MDRAESRQKCARENDEAVWLTRAGRLAEALALFDRIVDSFPDNGLFAFNRARACEAAGQTRAALQGYRHAWDCGQSDAACANQIGLMHYQLGEFAYAQDWYERALSLDSQCDLAWNNQGVLFFVQERYPDALGCFEKACALDAENQDYRINLRDTLEILEKNQKKFDR